MASATKNKKSSSTAKKSAAANQAEQKFNPESSSVATPQINSSDFSFGLFNSYVVATNKLEERIDTIEEAQKKQEKFFDATTKLSNISSVAAILLLLVPLIQLFLCAAVVYGMGIEDSLPNLLKWFLGGISIASLFEVIYSFWSIKSIKKRIEAIEEKLKEH